MKTTAKQLKTLIAAISTKLNETNKNKNKNLTKMLHKKKKTAATTYSLSRVQHTQE
jgi:hypothetical protein